MSVLQDFCYEYKTSASGSIIHEVTGSRGAFITHFSNFCKNKIDDGWLAEREDPKKLKE